MAKWRALIALTAALTLLMVAFDLTPAPRRAGAVNATLVGWGDTGPTNCTGCSTLIAVAAYPSPAGAPRTLSVVPTSSSSCAPTWRVISTSALDTGGTWYARATLTIPSGEGSCPGYWRVGWAKP